MADEVTKVNLTLNKDGVVAPALSAMRLATEMVSICLPAISNADFDDLPKLGDGFFQLGFNPEDRAAKVPIFHAWLLSKGIQELARGVRATLEEAYFYVTTLKQMPSWKTWADLTAGLAEIRRKANRMNFPDLTSAVQSELHSELDFASEFRSLQDVRNCLEHRNGVVAEIDLDEGTDRLTLSLPRMKFFVMKSDKEIELFAGQHVEAGTAIQMRREIRTRSYKVGEQIAFNPGEFHEIATACWFFASDVGAKLPDVEKKAERA